MANPQKEDGFIRIANELIEVFAKTTMRDSERRVLMAVLRKTYGFNKKEDRISISQICQLTTLARRTVVYALQDLESRNMILVDRKKVASNVNLVNNIHFQKDYDKWVVQGIDTPYRQLLERQKDKYKLGVVQGIRGSARNGKKVVQGIESDSEILAPTKDTLTKDIRKKEIRKKETAGKPPVPIIHFLKSVKNNFGEPIEFRRLKIEPDYFEQLKREFPDVNADEEAIKADLYLQDRPARKLVRHHSFLRNWFVNSMKFKNKDFEEYERSNPPKPLSFSERAVYEANQKREKQLPGIHPQADSSNNRKCQGKASDNAV